MKRLLAVITTGTGTTLLAAACLFFALAPGDASAEGYQGFARDWMVNCNERLYCIAETSCTSSSGDPLTFKLERANEPNGKVYVTVAPGHKLEIGMRVDIDVIGLDYGAYGEITKVYTGNEMSFVGDARRKLVNKLREGSKAQIIVRFGGDVGTVVYDVSLAGVSSVLYMMDEAQQRLDRTDAIVAWGGEPVTSLSAKPTTDDDALAHENQSVAATETQAEPTATVEAEGGNTWTNRTYEVSELPEAVAMQGYRTFGCDMEGAIQGVGAVSHGFRDQNELYLVPCQLGDANFEHYVAVIGPAYGNFANTYEFELPPGFNQPNRSTIINPQFDASSDVLTSTSYSSPNFDCGVFERHQYVADGDYFELVEYREKTACDGVATLPEEYALVWTIDEMGQ